MRHGINSWAQWGKTGDMDVESTLNKEALGNKNSKPHPLVEEALSRLTNFRTHRLKAFNTEKG